MSRRKGPMCEELRRKANKLKVHGEFFKAVKCYEDAVNGVSESDAHIGSKWHGDLEFERATCYEALLEGNVKLTDAQRKEYLASAQKAFSVCVTLMPRNFVFRERRAVFLYKNGLFNPAAQDFYVCKVFGTSTQCSQLFESCVRKLCDHTRGEIVAKMECRCATLNGDHMNLWSILDGADCIIGDISRIREDENSLEQGNYKKALVAISERNFESATLALLEAVSVGEAMDSRPECFLLLARIYFGRTKAANSLSKYLEKFLDWWSEKRESVSVERAESMKTNFFSLFRAASSVSSIDGTQSSLLKIEEKVKGLKAFKGAINAQSLVNAVLLLIGYIDRSQSDPIGYSDTECSVMEKAANLCLEAHRLNPLLLSATILLSATKFQLSVCRERRLPIEDLESFELELRRIPRVEQNPIFLFGMRLLFSLYYAGGYSGQAYAIAISLVDRLQYCGFPDFLIAMKSDYRGDALRDLASRNPESYIVHYFLSLELKKRDELHKALHQLDLAFKYWPLSAVDKNFEQAIETYVRLKIQSDCLHSVSVSH